MNAHVNIYASCVRLSRAGRALRAPADAGVLLLGDSGSGKSDVVLRLIAIGAQLVADDRTELVVERGRLLASPPDRLAGLLEIRGLGIVEMPHAPRARVALVVNLAGMVKRLPQRRYYSPPAPLALPLGARPPLINFSAFDASTPAKVVAAAAALHHHSLRDTVKRN
jgi:hypothetical protein